MISCALSITLDHIDDDDDNDCNDNDAGDTVNIIITEFGDGKQATCSQSCVLTEVFIIMLLYISSNTPILYRKQDTAYHLDKSIWLCVSLPNSLTVGKNK